MRAPSQVLPILTGSVSRCLSLLLFVAPVLAPATIWAQAAAPGQPKLTPLPHPEISPPDFPVSNPPPWWMVAGGILLGLALLTVLLWLLLKEKKSGPPPLHLPLKLAMQALQDLRSRLDQLTPQDAAHEVSAILRDYLQLRYALPAPFRTTEEIYQSAAMTSRQPLRNRFEPVAVLYDQLEFAPRPRTRADSENLVDTALEVLKDEQRQMAQPAALPPPVPPPLVPTSSPPALPVPPPLPAMLDISPPRIPPPSSYQS